MIEEAPGIAEQAEPAKRRGPAWIWASVAMLLLIALLSHMFFSARNREAPETARFQISVPPLPDDYGMAISPDGRAVAFVASRTAGAPHTLFVRAIGSLEPRQLEGTEGAKHPFWSPDSRSIGFFEGGSLKKIDLSGGRPVDLCKAVDFRGGTWNQNGVILFGDWPILRRVSAAGGEPATVTRLDQSAGE
jgi:hypothetical protein